MIELHLRWTCKNDAISWTFLERYLEINCLWFLKKLQYQFAFDRNIIVQIPKWCKCLNILSFSVRGRYRVLASGDRRWRGSSNGVTRSRVPRYRPVSQGFRQETPGRPAGTPSPGTQGLREVRAQVDYKNHWWGLSYLYFIWLVCVINRLIHLLYNLILYCAFFL